MGKIGRPTSWSEASVTEMTDLWYKGISVSVIGQKIGTTKNAVVGKIHRMGLARPERAKATYGLSRIKVSGNNNQTYVASPPRPLPKPNKHYQPPNPRDWETRRRGECAWPIIVDGVTLSCCDPVVEGKPYCIHHFTIGTVRDRNSGPTEANQSPGLPNYQSRP